jgi:N6-adenosine-specific RNA methylase IME4
MSIAQIAALRVRDIAHEHCIVWLWTTNYHMGEAFAVLAAWGFEPKTILTWVKDKIGYGAWLRCQTEHVIFATRDKPIVRLTNESTALFAPVGAHSEKPTAFYELVDRLCEPEILRALRAAPAAELGRPWRRADQRAGASGRVESALGRQSVPSTLRR